MACVRNTGGGCCRFLCLLVLPNRLPCVPASPAGTRPQHAGIHALAGGRAPHVHEGSSVGGRQQQQQQQQQQRKRKRQWRQRRQRWQRQPLQRQPASSRRVAERAKRRHGRLMSCLSSPARLATQPPSVSPRPHVAQVDSGRVYCLPDMYEVTDRSLADIQYVLNPTFTRKPRRRRHAMRAAQAVAAGALSTVFWYSLAHVAASRSSPPSRSHLPTLQPPRLPRWTVLCPGRAPWTAANTCLAWCVHAYMCTCMHWLACCARPPGGAVPGVSATRARWAAASSACCTLACTGPSTGRPTIGPSTNAGGAQRSSKRTARPPVVLPPCRWA